MKITRNPPTALRRSKRLLQKKDLLTNLPQEMTIEILRRLPIRSIMRCKCVCKSWRNLMEGGDFKRSYTPEPCFAFVNRDKGFAVCDEDYDPLFGFNFPPFYHAHTRVVIGSANGLILLRDGCGNTLFICNPLTREYVKLPRLPLLTRSCTFGFGVSKLTGQYKIVCGDQFRSYCVYTLGGEGLWRSIAAAPPRGNKRIIVPRGYTAYMKAMKALFRYDFEENWRGCCFLNRRAPGDYAVFFNGNLHWLEYDSENNLFVSCFDLETELFTKFSLPDYDGGKYDHCRLCVMEGRLCFCDIIGNDSLVVIWWMNNYGDDNTWGNVCTSFKGKTGYGFVYPLKVLENDDLLFALDCTATVFINSKNTEGPLDSSKTKYYFLKRPTCYYSNIVIYTPSFLSLKTMGIHNVQTSGFY